MAGARGTQQARQRALWRFAPKANIEIRHSDEVRHRESGAERSAGRLRSLHFRTFSRETQEEQDPVETV